MNAAGTDAGPGKGSAGDDTATVTPCPPPSSARELGAVNRAELAEYLKRKKALSREISPGIHLMDLSAEPPGPDPRIKFNRRNNTCTLLYRYPYEIDLDRITTPSDLLSWLLHLCEKNWMNTERLSEFAERVADFKGWRIHTDC